MMAAGTAAEAGAPVALLEKMERPGRKLRITGKGRGNLTNAALMETFPQRFGSGGRFLRSAFHRFSNKDLVRFLDALGVETVLERGERVFPKSGDAREVVDAFAAWLRRSNVNLTTNARVERIIVQESSVSAVELLWSDGQREVVPAGAVVLAAGGASYPATGSDGDGFGLAKSVGHSITPVHPGLVPMETSGDRASRLQGLSLRNVAVRVVIGGRKRFKEFGELVFTHFGLSGPVILTLSSKAARAGRPGGSFKVSIDLKPALDDRKLDNRLQRDLTGKGRQKLKNILPGLLPRKLIPVCLEDADISGESLGSQVTAQERKRLRTWLKDFRFQVTGFRPWSESIVTLGGVELAEVDPRSMRSKLIDGLYLAGEVLDIDADTGGYNLQAAFSTGRLAGFSAAAEVLQVG